MIELSEHVPIDLICLGLLGALGLRRLVRMDKYHALRVVILTLLLWVPTIYLVLLCCLPLAGPTCVVIPDESDAFTIME